MNNKDYALIYLSIGFSVIPTQGKKPLVAWQQYSKEKPTKLEIEEWWTKWPDADVACPTGIVSNLVVVDVDGGDVPSLPTTVTSETSPGHYQYFFKHPGFPIQNSAKVVANNIDIRGDGGFVVLPPSRHFNKETGEQDFTYKWNNSPEKTELADLPIWVLGKIKEKKNAGVIVQGSSQGSRNNDAASLIGSLLVRYPQNDWESFCWPLVEAWNDKNIPPLSVNEVRSVFESIASREASQYPRQNTTPFTVGTDLSRVNIGETPDSGISSTSYTPLLLSQLSHDENPVEWIWEGYLAKKHLTILSALWKAGKTTLITNLLKIMQEEGSLAGQNTHKANVLILSEESSTIWARRRDEHNITFPVWILSRPIRQKLGYKEWVILLEQMANFCEENKIDAFIIDTLSAFWSVDNENDAARVSAALLPLNYLLDKNIAVLLIHHFRKSGGDEGTASRGSGALGAGVDIMAEFSRLDGTDPHCTQRVIKTYSRFEESPKEVVIDYVDDEYITIGTKADVKRSEKLEAVKKALDDYSDGVIISDLHEKWNTDEYGKVPSRRTLQRYLSDLVIQGVVIIIGTVKIKGGNTSVYKLSMIENLGQTYSDKVGIPNGFRSENPSQDTELQELTTVEEVKTSSQQPEGSLLNKTKDTEALVKDEKALRQALQGKDKSSQEYTEVYEKWFTAREKGVNMGVFEFFVPSPNE
ncbi:MAG: bifunctional DNA primase/polymerase [Candidatus Levybacteria bacterium]|nr:bifunctional DNA primase/polymerase [Candidatus Levybacteria bacterium]